MLIELNQSRITDETVNICHKCGGSGRSRKWAGEETKLITCPNCKGTGEICEETYEPYKFYYKFA